MLSDHPTSGTLTAVHYQPLSNKLDSSGFNLAYHPFSLIVFLIWTAFIAVLVTLLELSAAFAPTSIHQPWYYNWLPGVLLTIFAQGHVAVTAMYLGRLGMSALHIQGYSPASWAELFWQADRKWQGPLGILSITYQKIKMRAQLSSTLILLAGTCMIATITPVLMLRAYPITTVDVVTQTMLQLNAFWPPQIETIESYLQVATGGGAWTTGTSVLSVYNSSVFIPAGTARVDTEVNDVFFAGDTLGADAEMKGVRTHGQCQPLISGPVDNVTFANQMCPQLTGVQSSQTISSISITNITWWGEVTISLAWCSTSNGNLMGNTSALVWLNASNSTETVQGVVKCNVMFGTGTAKLNGRDRTFTEFQDVTMYNGTTAQGGEPLLHPTDAALGALDQSLPYTKFSGSAMITMLGYNVNLDGTNLNFSQPSLDVMAQRLWQGMAHMGAAVGLLSQQNGHAYPVAVHDFVAGRTIDDVLARLVWALSAIWFLLLLGGTLMFFTPTFGDSLNSYVAARLLVENPALVEGYCCGSLQENMKMGAMFVTVGDSKVGETIGHVTPGGVGTLNKNRKYAATHAWLGE
jgi:hypothetical protein